LTVANERRSLLLFGHHIITVDGASIPIDRKSRHVSERGPHEGEVLQLAAYCLLVEEHFSAIVTRGTLAISEPQH